MSDSETIAAIQNERQREKDYYLAEKKAFSDEKKALLNEIEADHIKIKNLVLAVKEMRAAQKAFFFKRKKSTIANCLSELEYSRRLENEMDVRLS